MTNKQKRVAVIKALDYLIAEGMVVKEGKNYRLKTKKEQQEELNCIKNERE
jgi:hypothetical protein